MTTRQIGVGAAVLAALAAQGKDFDRDELNAMLDKLAASPEPKVRSGPLATCYSVAMPRPETFEYVCPKCGTHTVYPKNTLRMKNVLARYRDGAASLRALGLDIALDESVLCGKCRSARELEIPTRGKVVKAEGNATFGIGEVVAIKSYGHMRCRVAPIRADFWISARYISETGDVRGDGVNVRFRPSLASGVVRRVNTGDKLERRPPRPGDPPDWVRVVPPSGWTEGDEWTDYGELIDTNCLGELSYDETDGAALARLDRLAWVINGKRTIAQHYDSDILRAFLKGEKVRRGDCDETIPLKRDLPRLQVLLGPDLEPPPPAR